MNLQRAGTSALREITGAYHLQHKQKLTEASSSSTMLNVIDRPLS